MNIEQYPGPNVPLSTMPVRADLGPLLQPIQLEIMTEADILEHSRLLLISLQHLTNQHNAIFNWMVRILGHIEHYYLYRYLEEIAGAPITSIADLAHYLGLDPDMAIIAVRTYEKLMPYLQFLQMDQTTLSDIANGERFNPYTAKKLVAAAQQLAKQTDEFSAEPDQELIEEHQSWVMDLMEGKTNQYFQRAIHPIRMTDLEEQELFLEVIHIGEDPVGGYVARFQGYLSVADLMSLESNHFRITLHYADHPTTPQAMLRLLHQQMYSALRHKED